MMLKSTDAFPLNFAFTGKGNTAEVGGMQVVFVHARVNQVAGLWTHTFSCISRGWCGGVGGGIDGGCRR